VDEPPREYGIEMAIDVTTPAVTQDHTAHLRVTFENTGNAESPALGTDRLYELSPVTEDYSLSAPDEILLYAVDIPWVQPTRSDVCWRTDERGGPGDGGAGRPPFTLDPGTTITREYRVWDARPGTPCMPPGEYRYGFRTEAGGEGAPPFEWMFSLSIERT
jgi:hypothetical protein